jgi:Ran GTPase-activating protein (RanGAP) involved in mRNA processing and transport
MGQPSFLEDVLDSPIFFSAEIWNVLTKDYIVDEIGSEGVRSVATALKSNTTLTTLNLACNRIDLVGAQLLAEVLKSNTSLTSLNLACKWRNRA